MGEAGLRVCTDTRHSHGRIWTKSWADAHVEVSMCGAFTTCIYVRNEMVKMSGLRNKSKGEKKKVKRNLILKLLVGPGS